MAFTRLIPVPNSPTVSGPPDPPPPLEGTGNTSASFDRKRAPPQAPRCESAKYVHLSYDHLRDLCQQRGYHEKDAKVVLKTRLEAMDAAARQPLKSNENDMDTSSSVLGKRDRPMAEPSNIDNSTSGVEGKRSRRNVPATTLAADLAVVQTHAQWWPPDLNPKIEANQCSVV